MKGNVFLILLLMGFIYSCGLFKFASGVADDSHNTAVYSRKFINGLNFVGVVKSKEILNKRYLISIEKTEEKGQLEPFADREYYSNFNTKGNTLNISTSKALYDSVKINDLIIKLPNTDSVVVKKKVYKFYDW